MMMDGWAIHASHHGRISGNVGSQQFKACVKSIRNDPNIVELQVDRMNLNEEAVTSIRRCLLSRKWKSITLHDSEATTSLEVWNKIVSPSMVQAVRLEVRRGICMTLAQSISVGLRQPDCCLKKLSLTGGNINLETAVVIGEALSSSHALEEFALTNCRLSNDVLASLLGLSSRLRVLYLCDCHLHEDHVAQLVDSLSYHPRLKQLWLNGTQDFGSDASKILLEGLKTHTELEHIQLPTSQQCCPKMVGYMELNRGGRRLLGDPDANLALWPLVLERVGRIRGLSHTSRANILYFFVHQLHGREQLR